MGGKVDTIGAANILITKALGIGEQHEKNDGREFALSLLAMRISEVDNLVRHLLIEIPQWGQQCVDRAAQRAAEKQLPKLVEEPLIGGLQEPKRDLPLATVVSTALLIGVKVHCADVSWGTSPNQITERNKKIAENVKLVAQTNFGGCLLLCGSDHFDGEQSVSPITTLCQLIDQMDWVKF